MFDDDDWQDLERPAKGAQKADVTISVRPYKAKNAKAAKMRAVVCFRREAADWLRANGPRFRVQIGGAKANGLRFVADNARGTYEPYELKGNMLLSLGFVSVWADEERDETPAQWREANGALVLTLPDDFAQPRGKAASPPPPSAPAAPPRLISPRPAPAEPVDRDAAIDALNDPPPAFPAQIGGVALTRSEREMLDCLLKRAQASRAALLMATHDPRKGEDERDEKTIDVLVCKLRAKLAPLGVAIGTEVGGYRLDLSTKSRLRQMMTEAA